MINVIAILLQKDTSTIASTMESILIAILAIAAIVALLYIRIGIAYNMAKSRHRDPLGWALLSFFFSAILTWIILLIVGDAHDDKVEQKP